MLKGGSKKKVKKMDEEKEFWERMEGIENPIVKRSLVQRRDDFMFNYGDEFKHSEVGNHSDWPNYREYNTNPDKDWFDYNRYAEGRR